MNIWIWERTIFEEPSYFTSLSKLWHTFEDGRHTLLLSDETLLDDTPFLSDGLSRHRQRLWTVDKLRIQADPFLEKRTLRPEKPPAILCAEVGTLQNDSSARYRLSVEKAGDWANNTPLLILVEDMNDGYMLEAFFEAYHAHRLKQALEKKWLLTSHMGGTPHIRRQLEKVTPTDRLFVLIDSDRKSKAADLPPAQTKIQNLCTKSQVPIHILLKHEMENYLPEAFLAEIAGSSEFMQEKLESWRALSDERKDFGEMKRHFKHSKAKESEPSKVTEALSIFKHSESCTRDNVESRAGDEIQRLLETIEAYL